MRSWDEECDPSTTVLQASLYTGGPQCWEANWDRRSTEGTIQRCNQDILGIHPFTQMSHICTNLQCTSTLNYMCKQDCSSLLQPARSAEGRQTAHLYFSPSWSAEGHRLLMHLYSSQQGPLRAGRLRISTSAFQGPLRAADCASLLQPSKVLWESKIAHLPIKKVCVSSFVVRHYNMFNSPPPTVFRVISVKSSIRRRRLSSEKLNYCCSCVVNNIIVLLVCQLLLWPSCFYLPHMMTTEEKGEALAGETWAGERMSLSAQLPEQSLPVQVP